jgi:hypothetical protein
MGWKPLGGLGKQQNSGRSERILCAPKVPILTSPPAARPKHPFRKRLTPENAGFTQAARPILPKAKAKHPGVSAPWRLAGPRCHAPQSRNPSIRQLCDKRRGPPVVAEAAA